jgi:hypothetical protein
MDAVTAGAAVAIAFRLVPRQVNEDRVALRRRARADPATLPGDDELRETHRAVRGDPVGKGRGCPGHVDVRRPTVVGDDLRHGSGLSEQRVQVADRRRFIAYLACDYDSVKPGAQLEQPRQVASAGRTQILDPVPAAKRDDIFQAG